MFVCVIVSTIKMAVKDLILLALRVFVFVSLVFLAEQGGLAKYNMGANALVTNVVKNLGFPFNIAALQLPFAYAVMFAEFVAPALLLLGVFSRFAAFAMSINFAVASWAHVILWKQGWKILVVNNANVVGCGVYFVAAVILLMYGAGSYALGAKKTAKKGKRA